MNLKLNNKTSVIFRDFLVLLSFTRNLHKKFLESPGKVLEYITFDQGQGWEPCNDFSVKKLHKKFVLNRS